MPELNSVISTATQNIDNISRVLTEQSASLAVLLVRFQQIDAINNLSNEREVLDVIKSHINSLQTQTTKFARVTKVFLEGN